MTEEQARAVAVVAQAHNPAAKIVDIRTGRRVSGWYAMVQVADEKPVTLGCTESLMYWLDEH